MEDHILDLYSIRDSFIYSCCVGRNAKSAEQTHVFDRAMQPRSGMSSFARDVQIYDNLVPVFKHLRELPDPFYEIYRAIRANDCARIISIARDFPRILKPIWIHMLCHIRSYEACRTIVDIAQADVIHPLTRVTEISIVNLAPYLSRAEIDDIIARINSTNSGHEPLSICDYNDKKLRRAYEIARIIEETRAFETSRTICSSLRERFDKLVNREVREFELVSPVFDMYADPVSRMIAVRGNSYMIARVLSRFNRLSHDSLDKLVRALIRHARNGDADAREYIRALCNVRLCREEEWSIYDHVRQVRAQQSRGEDKPYREDLPVLEFDISPEMHYIHKDFVLYLLKYFDDLEPLIHECEFVFAINYLVSNPRNCLNISLRAIEFLNDIAVKYGSEIRSIPQRFPFIDGRHISLWHLYSNSWHDASEIIRVYDPRGLSQSMRSRIVCWLIRGILPQISRPDNSILISPLFCKYNSHTIMYDILTMVL